MATAAGDQISNLIDVCSMYGGTETGQIHQLFPSREDWSCMEFHPAEDLTMEPAEDDTYKLVMHVNSRTEGMSHLHHNFPVMTQWKEKRLRWRDDIMLAHCLVKILFTNTHKEDCKTTQHVSASTGEIR